MRNRQRGGAEVFAILYLLLWVFGIIGYVLNIVKLIGHVHDPSLTVFTVLRIIGLIAAPLGAILGYVPG